MTGTTVGHQVVEQVAATLEDRDCVSEAVIEENHKGPFVRAFVPDRVAKDELYSDIEQYPCYIDVVVQ